MIPKKAISTRLTLAAVVKASRSGAWLNWSSSFNLAKCGLSASRARIHTEIASSIADARNGIRQPQLAN